MNTSDTMYGYVWHDSQTDVDQNGVVTNVKFGETWVRSTDNATKSVNRRIRDSLGVRKDRMEYISVDWIGDLGMFALKQCPDRFHPNGHIDDFIRQQIGNVKPGCREVHEMSAQDFTQQLNHILDHSPEIEILVNGKAPGRFDHINAWTVDLFITKSVWFMIKWTAIIIAMALWMVLCFVFSGLKNDIHTNKKSSNSSYSNFRKKSRNAFSNSNSGYKQPKIKAHKSLLKRWTNTSNTNGFTQSRTQSRKVGNNTFTENHRTVGKNAGQTSRRHTINNGVWSRTYNKFGKLIRERQV